MSDLYWLSKAQVERLRHVLSGIIYTQRNGLM